MSEPSVQSRTRFPGCERPAAPAEYGRGVVRVRGVGVFVLAGGGVGRVCPGPGWCSALRCGAGREVFGRAGLCGAGCHGWGVTAEGPGCTASIGV